MRLADVLREMDADFKRDEGVILNLDRLIVLRNALPAMIAYIEASEALAEALAAASGTHGDRCDDPAKCQVVPDANNATRLFVAARANLEAALKGAAK